MLAFVAAIMKRFFQSFDPPIFVMKIRPATVTFAFSIGAIWWNEAILPGKFLRNQIMIGVFQVHVVIQARVVLKSSR